MKPLCKMMKVMSKDLNNGNWIVLYHANWCPHCVTFVPIFKKFEEQVRKAKLPIKIAAIEQTHHNEDSGIFSRCSWISYTC